MCFSFYLILDSCQNVKRTYLLIYLFTQPIDIFRRKEIPVSERVFKNKIEQNVCSIFDLQH